MKAQIKSFNSAEEIAKLSIKRIVNLLGTLELEAKLNGNMLMSAACSYRHFARPPHARKQCT